MRNVLRRRLSVFAVGAVFLAFAGHAVAGTVSIAPVKDNTLFSEDGALSNGAGMYLFAGVTNFGGLRRALLQFDIAAAIPAGATINGATLTLSLSKSNSGPRTVVLRRVIAAWGEAGSDAGGEEGQGGAAAPGDATWTHAFFDTDLWISPGGDLAAGNVATSVVGSISQDYVWSGAGLTALVQNWLDNPQVNLGLAVIGDEAGTGSTKRFDSMQNPTVSVRPQLDVDFSALGATGACCAGDGTCTSVSDPGSACDGSYQGSGSTCGSNPCTGATGACCTADETAACGELTQSACASQGGVFQGAGGSCAASECPVVLTPYVDPLPIPSIAQPVSGIGGGVATYDIAARQITAQVHRDLPPTLLWGYGDGASGATTPGPVIEASVGEQVTVNWINDLRDSGGQALTKHHLDVDLCPHGASLGETRTVVHLHGAHTAAEFDGYPESTTVPGQSSTYEYPNNQLPALLWYHDHALGITRLNLYMGLAGFYIIRDDVEGALGLPAGEFEVPLMILDRRLRADGTLEYPSAWQEHFHGDKILVNGKVWPFMEVKPGKYRFRVVNASGSRTLTLSLSDGASFQMIGSDGGLLTAPLTLSEITLGPAERADLVMDFEAYAPGTEVILSNSAPAPFPGTPGVGVLPDVMKFVAVAGTGFTGAVAASLRPFTAFDEADTVVERDFELAKVADVCTGSAWAINGLGWDDLSEFPLLGTTEVWRFINRSGIMHPMHVHLDSFQIIDRQDFTVVNDEIVPSGSPLGPAPAEAGWKDTVQVYPNEIVRVITRFEDFKGRFAYHCHIAEHEDQEMMRQFETVVCGDTGGADGVSATDALIALANAVGAGPCMTCLCDVDGGGTVTATDALLILQSGVGQPVTLGCNACL